jgi:hypothetical protein
LGALGVRRATQQNGLLDGQPASESWQKMITDSCSGKISGVYNGEVQALPATAALLALLLPGSKECSGETHAVQAGICGRST